MQTALPLNMFVTSDVTFCASFESDQITLDDAETFVRLLKALIAGAQTEIQARIGQSFEILPIVTVSSGCIKIRIEVKPSSWKLEIRATVREVFLAIALAMDPTATGGEVPSPPPKISSTCEEAIHMAHQEAQESWRYFGKGFEAKYEATCGQTKIHSAIKVLPSHPE